MRKKRGDGLLWLWFGCLLAGLLFITVLTALLLVLLVSDVPTWAVVVLVGAPLAAVAMLWDWLRKLATLYRRKGEYPPGESGGVSILAELGGATADGKWRCPPGERR